MNSSNSTEDTSFSGSVTYHAWASRGMKGELAPYKAMLLGGNVGHASVSAVMPKNAETDEFIQSLKNQETPLEIKESFIYDKNVKIPTYEVYFSFWPGRLFTREEDMRDERWGHEIDISTEGYDLLFPAIPAMNQNEIDKQDQSKLSAFPDGLIIGNAFTAAQAEYINRNFSDINVKVNDLINDRHIKYFQQESTKQKNRLAGMKTKKGSGNIGKIMKKLFNIGTEKKDTPDPTSSKNNNKLKRFVSDRVASREILSGPTSIFHLGDFQVFKTEVEKTYKMLGKEGIGKSHLSDLNMLTKLSNEEQLKLFNKISSQLQKYLAETRTAVHLNNDNSEQGSIASMIEKTINMLQNVSNGLIQNLPPDDSIVSIASFNGESGYNLKNMILEMHRIGKTEKYDLYKNNCSKKALDVLLSGLSIEKRKNLMKHVGTPRRIFRTTHIMTTPAEVTSRAIKIAKYLSEFNSYNKNHPNTPKIHIGIETYFRAKKDLKLLDSSKKITNSSLKRMKINLIRLQVTKENLQKISENSPDHPRISAYIKNLSSLEEKLLAHPSLSENNLENEQIINEKVDVTKENDNIIEQKINPANNKDIKDLFTQVNRLQELNDPSLTESYEKIKRIEEFIAYSQDILSSEKAFLNAKFNLPLFSTIHDLEKVKKKLETIVKIEIEKYKNDISEKIADDPAKFSATITKIDNDFQLKLSILKNYGKAKDSSPNAIEKLASEIKEISAKYEIIIKIGKDRNFPKDQIEKYEKSLKMLNDEMKTITNDLSNRKKNNPGNKDLTAFLKSFNKQVNSLKLITEFLNARPVALLSNGRLEEFELEAKKLQTYLSSFENPDACGQNIFVKRLKDKVNSVQTDFTKAYAAYQTQLKPENYERNKINQLFVTQDLASLTHNINSIINTNTLENNEPSLNMPAANSKVTVIENFLTSKIKANTDSPSVNALDKTRAELLNLRINLNEYINKNSKFAVGLKKQKVAFAKQSLYIIDNFIERAQADYNLNDPAARPQLNKEMQGLLQYITLQHDVVIRNNRGKKMVAAINSFIKSSKVLSNIVSRFDRSSEIEKEMKRIGNLGTVLQTRIKNAGLMQEFQDHFKNENWQIALDNIAKDHNLKDLRDPQLLAREQLDEAVVKLVKLKADFEKNYATLTKTTSKEEALSNFRSNNIDQVAMTMPDSIRRDYWRIGEIVLDDMRNNVEILRDLGSIKKSTASLQTEATNLTPLEQFDKAKAELALLHKNLNQYADLHAKFPIGLRKQKVTFAKNHAAIIEKFIEKLENDPNLKNGAPNLQAAHEIRALMQYVALQHELVIRNNRGRKLMTAIKSIVQKSKLLAAIARHLPQRSPEENEIKRIGNLGSVIQARMSSAGIQQQFSEKLKSEIWETELHQIANESGYKDLLIAAPTESKTQEPQLADEIMQMPAANSANLAPEEAVGPSQPTPAASIDANEISIIQLRLRELPKDSPCRIAIEEFLEKDSSNPKEYERIRSIVDTISALNSIEKKAEPYKSRSGTKALVTYITDERNKLLKMTDFERSESHVKSIKNKITKPQAKNDKELITLLSKDIHAASQVDKSKNNTSQHHRTILRS